MKLICPLKHFKHGNQLLSSYICVFEGVSSDSFYMDLRFSVAVPPSVSFSNSVVIVFFYSVVNVFF